MDTPPQHRTLRRELGLWGAVLLGLGSIIGTGIFVSLALGTEIAGSGVLLALVIAALLATANGLSSAQLAASHAVSGGTYEYAYKYLHPWLGWAAGWLFVCAKTASAATAALGTAAYLNLFAREGSLPYQTWTAIGTVLVLGAIILTGLRRTSILNSAVVTITLLTLTVFVTALWRRAEQGAEVYLFPLFADATLPGVLHAAALMFVAYTGYGRVATLGEEVHKPRQLIPRAIVITLIISFLLYVSVAYVSVASIGPLKFGAITRGAALAYVAWDVGPAWLPRVVSAGALTAMLGVQLNLILGVSRVVLAMGRRGDIPRAFASVNTAGTTPVPAVIFTTLAITALALTGSIKLTWSFSALTVLFYYAVTNACALAMPQQQRMFPRWVAWAGLVCCLSLALWIDTRTWLLGAVVVGAGLLWRLVWRKATAGVS